MRILNRSVLSTNLRRLCSKKSTSSSVISQRERLSCSCFTSMTTSDTPCVNLIMQNLYLKLYYIASYLETLKLDLRLSKNIVTAAFFVTVLTSVLFFHCFYFINSLH